MPLIEEQFLENGVNLMSKLSFEEQFERIKNYKKKLSLNVLLDAVKFRYLPLDLNPIYTKKNYLKYLRKLLWAFFDEVLMLKKGETPDYDSLVKMLESM